MACRGGSSDGTTVHINAQTVVNEHFFYNRATIFNIEGLQILNLYYMDIFKKVLHDSNKQVQRYTFRPTSKLKKGAA